MIFFKSDIYIRISVEAVLEHSIAHWISANIKLLLAHAIITITVIEINQHVLTKQI